MKTDSQIQAEVANKLALEPAIDRTSIGVAVKDGVVMLSGQVTTFTAKYAAERAAQSAPDIKALAVDINVVRYGDPEHTDGAIARAIELALESKHGFAKARVRVMVEGGCVTLSGEMESDQIRSAVADTVSRVMGVSGVNEKMTIRPPLPPAVAKAQFAVEMERRCGADICDDIATQI
jgi:osmotically-inducible protein OsmY